MKISVPQLVVGLNLFGLAILTILEAWRPGMVSGPVSIGLVWFLAAVTSILAYRQR